MEIPKIEILPLTNDFLNEVYSNSPQEEINSMSLVASFDNSFSIPPVDSLDARQYYLNHTLNEDLKKSRNEDVTAQDILDDLEVER